MRNRQTRIKNTIDPVSGVLKSVEIRRWRPGEPQQRVVLVGPEIRNYTDLALEALDLIEADRLFVRMGGSAPTHPHSVSFDAPGLIAFVNEARQRISTVE